MSHDDVLGSQRTDLQTDQRTAQSIAQQRVTPENGGRTGTTEQARAVAANAADAAKQVGAEATDQLRAVADQAKVELRSFVDQATSEMRAHADSRSQQATTNLRSLAGQLEALASGRASEAGPLVGYVNDARRRAMSLADHLEARGPDGIVDDVASFARRRPGLFLLASAGAGLAAGRMFRAERAANSGAGNAQQQLARRPMVPGQLVAGQKGVGQHGNGGDQLSASSTTGAAWDATGTWADEVGVGGAYGDEDEMPSGPRLAQHERFAEGLS